MSDTKPNVNKTPPETRPTTGAPAPTNGRAVSDTVRQGGHTAAEATRRAGEVGAETLRRSTEPVAESHRQIAHQAAERVQDVTRAVAETAHDTAKDAATLMTLPTMAEGGLQELHHGIAGLIESVVQTNLRVTQELFRLSSPAAFVELQQRFVRDYMNAVIEGSAAFVRAVHRTADQRSLEASHDAETGGHVQAAAE